MKRLFTYLRSLATSADVARSIAANDLRSHQAMRRDDVLHGLLLSTAPGTDPKSPLTVYLTAPTDDDMRRAALIAAALMEQTLLPRRILVRTPDGWELPASLVILRKRGLETIPMDSPLPDGAIEIPLDTIPDPDMLEYLTKNH